MINKDSLHFKDDENEMNRLDECTHGGLHSIDNIDKIRLDFSSNINPLGISTKVMKKITKNINNISDIYPDPKCKELKKKISEYLGQDITPDWITVGNGATELIHHFVRSFPYNAIIPIPTFCEYELAVRRSHLKVDFITYSENFRVDWESLLNKSKKRDKSIVFLCNPNNPTGKLIPVEIMNSILNKIKNDDTIIFIDESFIEFVNNHKQYSMISQIKATSNILVLRSMTKSFGLAGLRLGYLVANPNLLKKINQNQIAWNVNSIAQLAGIEALEDLEHLRRAKLMIETEKTRLRKRIKQTIKNLTIYDSAANFLLIELKDGDSKSFRDKLLENFGILVRDCSSFRGLSNKFIRIAIRTPEENDILLKSLEGMNNFDN